MERQRRRGRDASPPPPPPSVGFRSWVMLLLFSILVLLFFPSFLSSSFRGFRPFAVRNGWDALNLLLVLFAVLCGVLSHRSGGGDGADRFPRQSAPEEWLGFAHSHHPVETSPGAGVFQLRSGSSYPPLRPEGATLDASGGVALRDWHRYDDTQQLYRQRVESRGWERERVADSESKMIAVDTDVVRRSPSPRSRSPPSPPSPSPPPQPPPTRRAVDELPVSEVDKNEIFVLQNPHSPPSPPPAHPSQRQPRRRRKAEKVPEGREVDKDEIFGSENPHPRSPSHAPLTQRQRRRRSMEKFSEGEVGQNATFEDNPLQASETSRYRRRRRSVGDIPKREVDQDPSLGLEKPHISPRASPPSPPLALPSPQPQEEKEEEEKSHKKRSGGRAKDIASAIALLYPKKKGNKTKKCSKDTTLRGEDPASSAPLPPPPPPLPPPPPHSSVFHLFSQKKVGSNNRRIHSDSASAQPPPPPPTLTRQSREQVLHSSPPAPAPSPSPPAPPSHNWHDKGKEKVYPNESSPLPPSSSLPPRPPEKSNLSSPFPPRPPHPPSSMKHPFSEEEMAAHRIRRAPEEEVAMMKFKERESKERVAVSCPSPDVDDKADLFIARCHENWKLEKENSMREKERRKQRKESKRV